LRRSKLLQEKKLSPKNRSLVQGKSHSIAVEVKEKKTVGDTAN